MQSENLPISSKSIEDITNYIAVVDKRFSENIRRSSRTIAIVLLAAVLVMMFFVLAIWFVSRSSPNDNLIEEIKIANSQITNITQQLLQSNIMVGPEVKAALEFIVKQSELHRAAIEELRKADQKPSQDGQSLLQLVGTSIILALIGALGLQRLQNLDTEISNLRDSVFAQAEARSKADRAALELIMENHLQSQLSKMQQQSLETIQKDIVAATETFAGNVKDLRGQIESMRSDINETKLLLEKYPWLTSKEDFEKVRQLDELASVGQAHDLATRLNHEKDPLTAREALKKIGKREITPEGERIVALLPGTANDFHNAFSEAMRMEELDIAYVIIEAGLSKFPIQFDLVADKTRVMSALGKTEEARRYIETWRTNYPDEFTRSWRPVVFYVDLFDETGISQESIDQLEEALKQVTLKQPYEVKPWASYFSLLSKLGRFEEAEQKLREGLKHVPFSQQLNYMLGEFLLQRGKVDQALSVLEKALKIDYQDQFQSDVNQYAVWMTLAQAYEANGEFMKAAKIYKSVVSSNDRNAKDHFKAYAHQRLSAISLIIDQAFTTTHESSDLPEKVVSEILQKTFRCKTSNPEDAQEWFKSMQRLLEDFKQQGPEWANEVALAESILDILGDRPIQLPSSNPYYARVQETVQKIEAYRTDS